MKHHKYYVYILKCANGRYYTGVTNNLEKRMGQHLSRDKPQAYTTRHGPVELVFFTTFSDINYAIDREKQIKSWSHAKKRALINGDYEHLPNLSKKKF